MTVHPNIRSKYLIYFYSFLFLFLFSCSSVKETLKRNEAPENQHRMEGEQPGQASQAGGGNGPLNERISFIIGPGASYISQKLYDIPSINQTNNNVLIDEASKIKTNLAVGLIYTPYIYDITRTQKYIDENNVERTRTIIESVPKGRTISVFFNPIALSGITQSQPFFNAFDFGVGLGYRYAGGLLLMATAEFFSVKQPRKSFVDEFKNNNKPYTINGATQKNIDINDNSVFTSRNIITIGFKACFTFDIIKNYAGEFQNIMPKNNQSPPGNTNQNPPANNQTPPANNNQTPGRNNN